jgi:hypothetical protein
VLQQLPSGLHGAVGDALKRVKVQNSSMAARMALGRHASAEDC